jgi:hypothetical protein
MTDSYNPTYAYFSPTSALDFSTTYQITVDQGISDKSGNALAEQFSSTFYTAPFKVTSTSPQNGAIDVSLYSGASIYIYFSGPIDIATVYNAFSISPAVIGDFNAYENRINFNTNQSLAPGTTYTCTLSTALKAKNGTPLSEPVVFSFTTEEFRVNDTYPYNGNTNVSTTTEIRFQFNAPIDQSSVASAFSISPSVQGTFSFSSSNYFYFYPSQPLKSGTTYTVTLSTDMKSQSGGSLKEPYEFQFTTAPFRVTSTSPNNNSYDVNPNSIYVYFSGVIDTGTVRSAFSISPAIAGNFYLSNNSSQFQFYPNNNQFGMGKKYTVTLSTAMKSKDGSQLPAPYSFSFTTRPFQITSTDPSNGYTGVYRYTSIYIYTNASVNMSTASTAFSISPSIVGTLSSLGNGFYFHPQNSFAANTQYTVTVSTKLKATIGDTLLTERTFSFTTGQ